MDFDDNFLHIGADFLEKDKNPQIDIRKINEEILKKQKKKLTEDKFVIRVNPSDVYPNPDETGNGIDMATEAKKVINPNVIKTLDNNNKTYEKNILLIKHNRELFARCLSTLKETSEALLATYDRYKIDVNKRKHIDILFTKAMQNKYSYVNTNYIYTEFNFGNLIEMFTKIYKALDLLHFNKDHTYYGSIEALGDKFFEMIDYKLHTSFIKSFQNRLTKNMYNQANEIVKMELNSEGTIEKALIYLFAIPKEEKKTKCFIGEVISNTFYVDEFLRFQNEMIKPLKTFNYDKAKKYIDIAFEKETASDLESNCNLYSTLSFLYYYILNACIIATNINMDFQNIMFLIEPTVERMRKEKLSDLIEIEDAWVSCDYHLLREFLKGVPNIERTEKIIEMHNKYVKKNDLFLYLGDLSEQEFYDIKSKENQKYLDLLIKLSNKLNGRKIIIIGNNDTGSDNFYKQCGFIEVIREPILLGNHVFSHEPIKTEDGVLNVHGHIHGSKVYWDGVNPEDHIDAYYGIYGHPVKLSYLDEYYKAGKYSGCTTKI